MARTMQFAVAGMRGAHPPAVSHNSQISKSTFKEPSQFVALS